MEMETGIEIERKRDNWRDREILLVDRQTDRQIDTDGYRWIQIDTDRYR
jgi:hypothetical protein